MVASTGIHIGLSQRDTQNWGTRWGITKFKNPVPQFRNFVEAEAVSETDVRAIRPQPSGCARRFLDRGFMRMSYLRFGRRGPLMGAGVRPGGLGAPSGGWNALVR
jgi:hypothetical protein